MEEAFPKVLAHAHADVLTKTIFAVGHAMRARARGMLIFLAFLRYGAAETLQVSCLRRVWVWAWDTQSAHGAHKQGKIRRAAAAALTPLTTSKANRKAGLISKHEREQMEGSDPRRG